MSQSGKRKKERRRKGKKKRNLASSRGSNERTNERTDDPGWTRGMAFIIKVKVKVACNPLSWLGLLGIGYKVSDIGREVRSKSLD